jgi:hypothetical protein
MKYRVIEESPKRHGYAVSQVTYYVEFAKTDFLGHDTWHPIMQDDGEGGQEPKTFKYLTDAIDYIDSKVPVTRRRKVVYESVP